LLIDKMQVEEYGGRVDDGGHGDSTDGLGERFDDETCCGQDDREDEKKWGRVIIGF
jgi:hypothetical protein